MAECNVKGFRVFRVDTQTNPDNKDPEHRYIIGEASVKKRAKSFSK